MLYGDRPILIIAMIQMKRTNLNAKLISKGLKRKAIESILCERPLKFLHSYLRENSTYQLLNNIKTLQIGEYLYITFFYEDIYIKCNICILHFFYV